MGEFAFILGLVAMAILPEATCYVFLLEDLSCLIDAHLCWGLTGRNWLQSSWGVVLDFTVLMITPFLVIRTQTLSPEITGDKEVCKPAVVWVSVANPISPTPASLGSLFFGIRVV